MIPLSSNFGLLSSSATGGVVAFVAHVGGFASGYLVARLLTGAGPAVARDGPGVSRVIRVADGGAAHIV